MIENLTFTSYSVLKNEDAVPYADGGLLVVADGLGGAGSTVHEIDRDKHPDIREELIKTALFGVEDAVIERERGFVEAELAPMLDSEDDTSALWASRIAMLRFVLGIRYGKYKDQPLSDTDVRARLSKFVGDGLRKVAEHFGFEKGRYGGQVLLPTTLAALKYKDMGDEVFAEALWTGDSRIYLLDSCGIRQLTSDDEDSSGAITNLFYADTGDAFLHYKAYKIKKPCVLVALSDGAFDPYEPHENLGVEYSLLKVLSESCGVEDFVKGLKEYYDEIHADDASFAFAALGYGTLSDMKEKLGLRIETVKKIFCDLRRLSSSIKAINTDENEAVGYIYTRTKDKLEAIIRTLSLDSCADNPVFSKLLEGVVSEARERFASDAEKDGYEELRGIMLEKPYALSEIIHRPIDPLYGVLSYNTSALFRTASALISATQAYQDKRLEYSTILNEGEAMKQKILSIIEDCEKSFDEAVGEGKTESVAQQRDALKREHIWKNALLCLLERTTCQCAMKMSLSDRVLLDGLNSYVARSAYLEKGVLSAARRALEGARTAYENEVCAVIEFLKNDKSAAPCLISKEALGLIEKTGAGEKNGEVDTEAALRDKGEELVPLIVKALKENPYTETPIDIYYNKTRLSLFKEFFRLKNSPSEETESFVKALREYEEESVSLI